MDQALIEAASTEIAEYNATEAGLMALRQRMEGVQYDVTTTKGMVIAKADRAEVRGLRTGLEAMRKQIKAPALAHAKLIDDEAKRITAALLELETPIDEQIKARELALENERLAREKVERDRVVGINTRIANIGICQARATMSRTASDVQTLIDMLADVDMEGFDEFEDEAKATRARTMVSMEKIMGEKAANEAELARVLADQAAAAEVLAAERAALDADRAEMERFKQAVKSITPLIDEPTTQPSITKLRSAPPMRHAPEPIGTITTPQVLPVTELSVAPYYKSHAPSSTDIYAMCAESDTADQFAKWLCHFAGVPFPPINEGVIA